MKELYYKSYKTILKYFYFKPWFKLHTKERINNDLKQSNTMHTCKGCVL